MDLQSKVSLGVSLLSAAAYVSSVACGVGSYFDRHKAYNEMVCCGGSLAEFESADERMGKLGLFALVSSTVGFSSAVLIRSDEERTVEE